jgi:hypothetical protein
MWRGLIEISVHHTRVHVFAGPVHHPHMETPGNKRKRNNVKVLPVSRKRVKKEVLPFPEEKREEFYDVEWYKKVFLH